MQGSNSKAGSRMNMFDFTFTVQKAQKLFLDPSTELIRTSPSTFQVTSASGILVTLGIGAYKVSEESFLGFDASFSADCTGSIAPGDQKTCTVTNAAPVRMIRTVA
jgi:hypothetical protein